MYKIPISLDSVTCHNKGTGVTCVCPMLQHNLIPGIRESRLLRRIEVAYLVSATTKPPPLSSHDNSLARLIRLYIPITGSQCGLSNGITEIDLYPGPPGITSPGCTWSTGMY